MSKLGVLLVSSDGHQKSHMQGFQNEPRCEIIAVSDSSDAPGYVVERNRTLAQEVGVPYFEKLDDALVRDDIHIASVSAEVARRPTTAIQCAKAGKHVYLDKPAAGSISDMDKLASVVRESGVVCQMFSSSNSTWAAEAKGLVSSGRAGKVLAVHADTLVAKAIPADLPEGQVRREKGDLSKPLAETPIGGQGDCKRELMCWCVYPLSIILPLLDRKVKTVFGITRNYFSLKHLNNDVEDFSALLVTLEDGTVVTVSGSRIPAKSHPFNSWNRMMIIGSEGVFAFDPNGSAIETFIGYTPEVADSESVISWHPVQPETHGWTVDIGGFIDCIESGTVPDVDAKVAADVTEVMLAGYVSASRGVPVELPLKRD